MDIRAICPAEVEQARALLKANGWGPRVADPAVFQELLARSQLAIVAVEHGRVVGFLRALTDGLFNGRGRGISSPPRHWHGVGGRMHG